MVYWPRFSAKPEKKKLGLSRQRLVRVNILCQGNFYKSSAMSITRLGGGPWSLADLVAVLHVCAELRNAAFKNDGEQKQLI